MAKFIIVSPCRYGGKHHDKGEVIELDVDQAADARMAGELSLAGRIALATPEVMEQIKAEIRADQAALEKAAKKAEKAEK